MSARIRFRIVLLLLVAIVASSLGQENSLPKCPVKVTVALVAGDLTVRPVPKWPFIIRSSSGVEMSVVTSFDGRIEVELACGDYAIRSDRPVALEGRQYAWDYSFQLDPAKTSSFELSSDNAAVTDVEQSAAEPAADVQSSEGRLYNKLKDSVFLIETETGYGSGFLVDSRGLVLTNHHVVGDSRYLAVKIASQKKFPAQLLASDPKRDVALLRVNPEVVAGLIALPLAEDSIDRPPVSVGQRVLAIGSPLGTETILTAGLVSKVEEGVIHSDIKIAPGSSGGPLFEMSGKVIGINTFGQTRGGDQISGIIRVHIAHDLLESAEKLLAGSTPPESRGLPCPADSSFPPDDLRRIASTRAIDPARYHVEAGPMDIQFVTPVALAWAEIRADREAAEFRKKRTKGKNQIVEYTPGRDFYEWRRYAGDYKPVVRVQAIPEIGMTGGSIAAVLLLGANAPVQYKFKADFDRMELRRNGVIVEPIWPARAPSILNFQSGTQGMSDVAYYGLYEYPPEAFAPGASIELRVWEQGRLEPRVRQLSLQQASLIWRDFAAYFSDVASEVQGAETPPPVERSAATAVALMESTLREKGTWMTAYEIRLESGLTDAEFRTAVDAMRVANTIEVTGLESGNRYRLRETR